MSSNLTSLRLRLKSTFPTFQSLTLADLQELKWSLRQLIFLSIFQEAKLLEELSEQLQNLGEKRDKQMAIWKSAGHPIPKEEKMDFERDYRTSYMSIVLKGLEKTKWPPTLVPFSDPMDDLLHNKEVTFDAVNHFLKVLYPSAFQSKQITPTKETLPPSPVQSHSTEEGQASPLPPGSVKNTPRPTSTTSTREYATLNDSSYDSHRQVQNGTPIRKHFGKIDKLQSSDVSNISISSIQLDDSRVNSMQQQHDYSDTFRTEDKKLVENEILSTQLQQLKSAVSKRNRVEQTLSSLIQDINKSLMEIVEIGVNSSSSSSHSASNAHNNSSTDKGKNTICSECGGNISMDTIRSTSVATSVSTTNTAGRHAVSNNSASSASFSWRNVAGKLKQLEAQWTEATRAARQLCTSSSSTASNLHLRQPRTAVSKRVSTGYSESSGMLTGRSTHSAFSTASNNSFVNNSSPHNLKTMNTRSGKSMAAKTQEWVSNSVTGQGQWHHLTGSATVINSNNDDDAFAHEPNGSSEATSMALQRECMVLLSALEAWENIVTEEQELQFQQEAGMTSRSQTTTTQHSQKKRLLWLARYEQQTLLQASAQRLLSLLVASGGIGMLATNDMTQLAASRHMQQTALAQLIHKVEEDVFPRVKKHPSQQEIWSNLCDTALLEHVALSRHTVQHRQQQAQWQRMVRGLAEQVLTFGRATRKALEESCQKIHQWVAVLQEMMRHYTLADEARVTHKISLSTASNSTSQKTSASGGTAVSPMDALCRGVAGDEVAQLMTVLRRHHMTFFHLEEALQEMIDRFTKSILWEQSGLMKYLQVNLGQELPPSTSASNRSAPIVGEKNSKRSSRTSADSVNSVASGVQSGNPSSAKLREKLPMALSGTEDTFHDIDNEVATQDTSSNVLQPRNMAKRRPRLPTGEK